MENHVSVRIGLQPVFVIQFYTAKNKRFIAIELERVAISPEPYAYQTLFSFILLEYIRLASSMSWK